MLTNPIQVLSETELLGHKFTVYGTAENPLFLAKEVAECIDYAKRSNGSYNTTMMLQSVDEEEKVANIVDTPGGNQQVWFFYPTKEEAEKEAEILNGFTDGNGRLKTVI